MSEVFICPIGAILPRALRELRKAGVIVVEVTDPDRCKFVRASEVVNSHDMLWAAMKALNTKGDGWSNSAGHAQREALAKIIFDLVDAARTKKTDAA